MAAFILPSPALQIDRAEVLRYLRWPSDKPLPPEIEEQLTEAEADILAAAQPCLFIRPLGCTKCSQGLALRVAVWFLLGRILPVCCKPLRIACCWQPLWARRLTS